MNVLFVSIAFPPKRDPECIQSGRYFKYLKNSSDLALDIVTSKPPTLFMPLDQYLKKYDQGYRKKIEIPIYENRYTNFLGRKFLPGGIDYPDSKWSFHKQWKKVIRQLKIEPDIIYSRSFPLSSALMGYKLQQYYKVPWIVHLSDPWYYSPVHNFGSWHKLWEERCLNEASHVCFTSHETINLYRRNYPHLAGKFQYFPNVYDDDEITVPEFEYSGKLRIVYTGGLTGERSVKWLEPVFELIKKNLKNADHEIEFIFAGDMDSINGEFFKTNSYKFVSHVGSLSYDKAKKLQTQAHLLLVIDNLTDNKDVGVFFPSKLLDYFMAQKKMLCITSKGSASFNVLNDKKAFVCTHDQSDKIFESVMIALENLKSGNASFFLANQPPNEFSAAKNANRLSNLFVETVANYEA